MSEDQINEIEFQHQDNSLSSLYSIEWDMAKRDERLNRTHRDLLSQINSLTRRSGYCFATNKHLAEEMRCSSRTITRGISHLLSCDYISIIHYIDKDNKQYLSRHIFCDKNVPNFPRDKNTVIKTTKKEYFDSISQQGKQPPPPYSQNWLGGIAKFGYEKRERRRREEDSPGTGLPGSSVHLGGDLNSQRKDKHNILLNEKIDAKSIERRKREKTYNYILDRINILSEMKIMPKIRKMTSSRSSKINAKIKLEPSIQFWKELFDKIEELKDTFIQTKWISFSFIFERENRMYEIVEGKYDNYLDNQVKFNSKESITTDKESSDWFENKEDQAVLDEVIEMVSDNVLPESEKENELAEAISQVINWGEPNINSIVAGQRVTGYIDYQALGLINKYKAYPEQIKKYSIRTGMPISVKMIKIGSKFWEEFEKSILDLWLFVEKEDVANFRKSMNID